MEQSDKCSEPSEHTDFELEDPPPYSHFSARQKTSITAIVALTSVIGTLSADMYLPVVDQVRDDLNTTLSGVTWTVTGFMLGLGVFPLIWCNLSDQFGRKPIYIVSMIIYTGGTIGCALSKSLSVLIICRIIQSAGAAAMQGAGSGTISDVYTRTQRGTALGVYYLGPLLGPCIGPVIGGVLGEQAGWRWVFWLLIIIGALLVILLAFVLPETHRRIIAKTHRIEMVAIPEKAKSWRENNPIVDIAKLRFFVIAVAVFHLAMVFGAYFTDITILPQAFKEVYGMTETKIGLGYLPVGAGTIVGSLCGGRMSDIAVRRHVKKLEEGSVSNAKAPPEIRLRFVWLGTLLFLCTLVASGWMIDKDVHLAGLLVMQFFVGIGMSYTYQTISTYLIDVFPTMSARITGVQSFVRLLWTAIIDQILPTMRDSVGWGWSYSIMGAMVVVGFVLIMVVRQKGAWLRARFGPVVVD